MHKIIIACDRTFSDEERVGEVLVDTLNQLSEKTHDREFMIVLGRATHIDDPHPVVKRVATDADIPMEVITAYHELYGEQAIYMRNKEMVEKSELLIAFWDGNDWATKDLIELAVEMGKDVIINYY